MSVNQRFKLPLPSTYHRLIYYQRIKYLELVIFSLIITFGLVIILAEVDRLWSKYVDDLLIVGSQPYIDYFESLLNKDHPNIKRRYIVAESGNVISHQGLLMTKPLPWFRQGSYNNHDKPIFTFPAITDNEIQTLASQYGLDHNLIRSCWQELCHDVEQYPQHQLLTQYATSLGTSEKTLYRYHLDHKVTSQSQSNISEVWQNPHLAHVKLRSGQVFYGRYLVLIDPNQEDIVRQYQDLDHPIMGRLEQHYTSFLSIPDESKIGSYFQTRGVTFRYQRDDRQGVMFFTTDVNLSLESDGYHLDGFADDEYSLAHLLGFNELPFAPIRLSYLFMPWLPPKLDQRVPFIIDRLNIPSKSPERDLLLILRCLSKVIVK